MLSLFPAIRLVHGQHVDLEWQVFHERYLARHEIRTPKDGRLFSFAVYHGNPERGDANVRAICGAVVDFDNSQGRGLDSRCSEAPTLPEHHFDNLGDLTFAWYSTHSNTATWPKWRLVIPFDREVTPAQWPAVFDGVLALLARDPNIDMTCGELSRAYYTPSCPPDHADETFGGFHAGQLACVDELLGLSTVPVGTNVHALPGAAQRNTGRNDALRAIAAAMLGRGEPVESIVLELLRADAHHNPPLFTDVTEGYRGTAESGALKFLGNIAYSQAARNVRSGMAPDVLTLRTLGDSGFVPSPAGESLIVMACDLPTALKPPQWLVRYYIEAHALSVLFGEPGAGKSFIGLDLGLSIATGKAWHTHRVQQTPVIYLCGEGWSGLQRRMHAWRDWHEVDWRSAPFALTKRAIALGNKQAVEALKRDIDAAIERLGDAPGLFIVDTLARNFGAGDENSTKDMSLFIDHVGAYLMDAYKAAVMLVHHTGHGDKQRARGSSSLKGAVDAEYFVTRSESGIVELSGLKMKDAPLPESLYFSMRVVDLGIRDEDGEPVTSVVPVMVSAPSAPPMGEPRRGAPRGSGDVQRACLELLVRMLAEARANLAQGGFDPLRARVSVKAWQSQAIEQRIVSDRKRFFDRRQSLESAGLVRVENGFAYPVSEDISDAETS